MIAGSFLRSGAGGLALLPLNIANNFCACSLLVDWRLSKHAGREVVLGIGVREALDAGVGVAVKGVVTPEDVDLDGISPDGSVVIGLGGGATD
jgi:hypothetical protein